MESLNNNVKQFMIFKIFINIIYIIALSFSIFSINGDLNNSEINGRTIAILGIIMISCFLIMARLIIDIKFESYYWSSVVDPICYFVALIFSGMHGTKQLLVSKIAICIYLFIEMIIINIMGMALFGCERCMTCRTNDIQIVPDNSTYGSMETGTNLKVYEVNGNDLIETVKDDPEIKQIEDDTCSICLENYNEKDLCRVLDCGHVFHQKCCDDWLKTKDTCPYCRNSTNLFYLV